MELEPRVEIGFDERGGDADELASQPEQPDPAEVMKGLGYYEIAKVLEAA